MNDFIKKHQTIWGDNPRQLLDDYDYQKVLTNELDNLDPKEFDLRMLYEIVLWKLDRFPEVSTELLAELKTVPGYRNGKHRRAEGTLKKLLRCRGIALPMASTILRFLNPKAFQIIDERAFRQVLPNRKPYRDKPKPVTDGYIDDSVEDYFIYLDAINKEIKSKALPFHEADRILYQLDIKKGNKLKKRAPAEKI